MYDMNYNRYMTSMPLNEMKDSWSPLIINFFCDRSMYNYDAYAIIIQYTIDMVRQIT